MLLASMDLGTNTCLLLIAKHGDKGLEIIEDFSTIVRLGQGVDQSKKLHPDAKVRTIACLKKYTDVLKRYGLEPSSVSAVATAQARDAEDGIEFFEMVQATLGLQFRTLSGDQEARLTFLGGLLPGMDPATSAVIDIGGGSTEFMAINGGKSLQIGSVRFTERYLKSNPVSDEEFWECEEQINAQLQTMVDWRSSLKKDIQVVAVAGTATTLASWYMGISEFNAGRIDATVLTRGDLHRLVEELKWRTLEERRVLKGMDAKRADVLLAGAMILWRSMEVLDFPNILVSTRGLRFGVLLDRK